MVSAARIVAAKPIVKRVFRYEDLGKHRTWLDGRAKALEGCPRQQWFALSMSDFAASHHLNNELPLLAAAYRCTGDESLKDRIIAQLEETATWSPLQRPGYTLYAPSPKPVPADFNDGNWLATGLGIRALADTLEIMPAGSLPKALIEKIHGLLHKEILSVADDWRTKRSWFIKANVPLTNQWVLPTEGLVRACLALGRDKYPEEYELGVRNLLAAMDSQGPQGEFCEGIGYGGFSVQSMLNAAAAMSRVGDMRGLNHPFLQKFPTWLAHHFQPGRSWINCFDATRKNEFFTEQTYRSSLSQHLVFTNNPVVRWMLYCHYSGPSEDHYGLLSRTIVGQPAPPSLFASYAWSCRVNWCDSWAEDATGAWVRGGHLMDHHDHYDRGHVNFISRGRPILIEAGTPSYDNPRMFALYQGVAGHNVLEIVGCETKKVPVPITVHRLDNAGGEVTLEPTAGYSALKSWRRRVTWNSQRMDVVDEVTLPPSPPAPLPQAGEGSKKPGEPMFRWHLGTQTAVTIAGSDKKFTATWPDAEISMESSVPIFVASEMAPDNTVALGQMVGPDYLHRCLTVRPVRHCERWTLKTHVKGR